MEKDKYYVPDIEDIRVGYECEIWESIAYTEEKYEPYTFEIVKRDLNNETYYAFGSQVEYIEDGVDKIRVPYLSLEQIEDEGWEGGVKSNKKGYIYSYMYKDKQLIIKKLSTTPFPDEVVFSGECKSINEFRYICKLLKI